MPTQLEQTYTELTLTYVMAFNAGVLRLELSLKVSSAPSMYSQTRSGSPPGRRQAP